MRAVPFGTAATDRFFPFNPVDIDGDGAQDIMINRSVGGSRVFYALRSSDGQPFYLQWGLASDEILLGDYDGDGKTDFVARCAVSGQLVWYIY